ncbi:MAG: TonB-dependent siderophore receptor [Rhodovulum sulfidophilum]|uniref:TonB-dependent siderophore receptor n=1 Tax=Rhodovulum sulfidophilum TaxID=35806 RepID=A0A2W5N684_RHOSU|nr:MAG: TonB-dependent siderophore receptor [Rhodovulum sulfidophilum]
MSWAARARLTTILGAGLLSLASVAAAQPVEDTAVVAGSEDIAAEDAATPGNDAALVLAGAADESAGESLELSEINVTAAPGTTTEDTGSWTTEWMRSATGMPLSQKETPQSTSVITDAQMKDRNITTVPEVMEAATGVTVQAFESDRINYYVRGFPVDSYQYDGVPVPRDGTWQFGDNNADMILYDHVEIVRGATGLMQGAGEPGASINFIRKRPTSFLRREVAAAIAYPLGARVEADVSGPLNESGTVRGRILGAIDSRESTLDRYSKDRYVGYGALDIDLSDSTLLNLGLSYQKTKADNATWGGLPPYDTNNNLIDWPWGFNLGADWTYVDTDRTEAFASLEHIFDNGWTGRLVYTYVKNDFDSQLAWISGVPDAETGLGMSSWAAKYDGGYDQNTLNAVVNGEFEALGRIHQFVVGAMGSDVRGDYYGYDVDFATLAPVGNVFDWNGSFPEPSFSSDATQEWNTRVKQYGVYGTLRFMATDSLALLGGARVNWWDGSNKDPYGGDYSYSHSGIVTPYVGFTYDINDVYTAYGSITSIYKPQLVQDWDGNYLDPTFGYNYELGVKAGLFDGAVYASAAVFQTNQKDVALWVGDIPEENRSVYEQVDGVDTRGFELELAGAITDRWNASLGYTYRYSEDGGEEVYTDQPRNTLKAATDYRVPNILQDKLTLGGAVRWQSGTDSMRWLSDVESLNVHQDSYAVFDFNASYDITEQTMLTLSVNNILNEKYYATTGFYDTVVYGEGIGAELMLRARF